MSLALATLIYEWRRYLAAIIALAFSGMMVMAFSGLFAGIIHADLATWERSRADLIILPPNAKSLVNSNASLPSRVKPLIYLNPDVAEVESIAGSGAQWINVGRARPEAGADLGADLRRPALPGLGYPADRLHRGGAPGPDGTGGGGDRRQRHGPAWRETRRQGLAQRRGRSGCARSCTTIRAPSNRSW
ncbi:MAG: hypothetical protein WDM85_02080 [Caulobacteraceae bacterium]